jgi:hypothetical protein
MLLTPDAGRGQQLDVFNQSVGAEFQVEVPPDGSLFVLTTFHSDSILREVRRLPSADTLTGCARRGVATWLGRAWPVVSGKVWGGALGGRQQFCSIQWAMASRFSRGC